MSAYSFADPNIKEPNVSGSFYSANPAQLSKEVDVFLKAAAAAPSSKKIDMVIVPHAGYVYSGPVAAYGYKTVSQNRYSTIIIIAPSHFFPFDGVSIWEAGAFKTPLGSVAVDEELAKKIISEHKEFYFDKSVFEREHSLEVQLPFLQEVFEDFKIVPILMGQPSFEVTESLADTLANVLKGREDVLIVISTDMSHYHDDTTARKMDHATIETIKKLDARRFWDLCTVRKLEMCGFVPVTTALLYAQKMGLTDINVLRYANSGDVTGEKDRVVGYTSITFSKGGKPPEENQEEQKGVAPLTQKQKRGLIDIAERTIVQYVVGGQILGVSEKDPRLLEHEGAFVTIHKNKALRGCIGNIVTDKPLYQTVRDMAIAAATQDPRFKPLTKEELSDIEVEISVLSKPERIKSIDEIQMGVHGVIVHQGPLHHGIFLPQVATETGWSKEEFLSQLCAQKAGLPPDAWKDPRTVIEIFSAQVFSEKDVE